MLFAYCRSLIASSNPSFLSLKVSVITTRTLKRTPQFTPHAALATGILRSLNFKTVRICLRMPSRWESHNPKGGHLYPYGNHLLASHFPLKRQVLWQACHYWLLSASGWVHPSLSRASQLYVSTVDCSLSWCSPYLSISFHILSRLFSVLGRCCSPSHSPPQCSLSYVRSNRIEGC